MPNATYYHHWCTTDNKLDPKFGMQWRLQAPLTWTQKERTLYSSGSHDPGMQQEGETSQTTKIGGQGYLHGQKCLPLKNQLRSRIYTLVKFDVNHLSISWFTSSIYQQHLRSVIYHCEHSPCTVVVWTVVLSLNPLTSRNIQVRASMVVNGWNEVLLFTLNEKEK